VATRFASGLRPVVLTRSVPIAGAHAKGKQSFHFSPKIRKPTLESAINLRRLCDSSGAVADIGLSEILAPDLIFTSAACPSQMGCDEEESYIRTRPLFDVHVRQVTGSSVVPFFNHPGFTWLA
jgi:hypothetical protein